MSRGQLVEPRCGGGAGLSVVVAIPCLNEAATIARVVADFRTALPEAGIYVYDNASTDATRQAAQAAGAVVRSEPRRGKGNVVRRIFRDLDADILVLVDGDGTYPANYARRMIDALVADGMDMISAARQAASSGAFPRWHRFGNALINRLVRVAFGAGFTDVLSGYRVFSRRFVKSFAARADRFEVEAEMAVHSLEMRLPAGELEIPYFERPRGSYSKLRTVRDGAAILMAIFTLIGQERPLALFLTGFAVAETAALVLAWPLLVEPLRTGLESALPTAALAGGLALLGFLGLAWGWVAQGVAYGRREGKRLHYLTLPGLPTRNADEMAVAGAPDQTFGPG